ncbi:MAG TPA: transposase [Thermodesulfobacteriota bacterium]|nr:transposase [Thermodesulfobacteriota bacterium]HNU70396.1 transposase [Thermodesulfobacteriota bacterium]
MEGTLTANEIAACSGINKRSVNRRAERESWAYIDAIGRGGTQRRYCLSSLPSDIQAAIVEKHDQPITPDVMPALAPAAELALYNKYIDSNSPQSYSSSLELPAIGFADGLAASLSGSGSGQWESSPRLGPKDLEKAGPWVRILQEAQNVPRGWKKRAWIENVATRHNTTFQTIYRKLQTYEKKGISGLVHRKETKGTAREWDQAALDFWVGLVLKRSHRKISKDALYTCLQVEAKRRGWRIGSYRSALWWLEQRITPQLRALQRGGVRALDNTLPPVLRDYSDLDPLEILVGDQHRWDFWVVDDETGEVFRPECYLWQDLRTRILYGAAVDHKYDSQLMGLALRIGIKIFGAFRNIYTDNGKQELSRYIMSILADVRRLGMEVQAEMDYPLDVADADSEDIMPVVTVGKHRKAIVRNAKAKMIEGTFNVLEGIMRNQFRLPGYVKELAGDKDENEIDEKEVKALAASGKLPTYREFVLTMYHAMDYYNQQKAHRGVLSEWRWTPKPTSATPFKCLEQCYTDGWRFSPLSDDAIDLVFLARPSRSRIVDRGRVSFQNLLYESDELISFNGQEVDLRYDPIDPSYVLCFYRGEYLCRAETVEYSSMKDMELAERKITEKYSRRREFIEQYRAITSRIPDVRKYSKIPTIEKAAAIIGGEKRARAAEQAELNRSRTDEELAVEVARLEERAETETLRRRAKALPSRPAFFLKEHDRFEWITKYELAGGELAAEDIEFKEAYEARMDIGQREYWEAVREFGAQTI